MQTHTNSTVRTAVYMFITTQGVEYYKLLYELNTQKINSITIIIQSPFKLQQLAYTYTWMI